MRERGSFPSASADLAHVLMLVLDKIEGARVSKQPRPVVRGHTDDQSLAAGR